MNKVGQRLRMLDRGRIADYGRGSSKSEDRVDLDKESSAGKDNDIKRNT
jgi:hypothetical protein